MIPQHQLGHHTPTQKAHLPLRPTYFLMHLHSRVLHVKLLMRWSENQWLPEDEASATIGLEVKD
jgi:hypothetical protein